MYVPRDKEDMSKYGILFSFYGLCHGMLCDTSVREEKILHLDPPNEKGKLQLDVIFANYFGCNERETGHFKSEAAASL